MNSNVNFKYKFSQLQFEEVDKNKGIGVNLLQNELAGKLELQRLPSIDSVQASMDLEYKRKLATSSLIKEKAKYKSKISFEDSIVKTRSLNEPPSTSFFKVSKFNSHRDTHIAEQNRESDLTEGTTQEQVHVNFKKQTIFEKLKQKVTDIFFRCIRNADIHAREDGKKDELSQNSVGLVSLDTGSSGNHCRDETLNCNKRRNREEDGYSKINTIEDDAKFTYYLLAPQNVKKGLLTEGEIQQLLGADSHVFTIREDSPPDRLGLELLELNNGTTLGCSRTLSLNESQGSLLVDVASSLLDLSDGYSLCE